MKRFIKQLRSAFCLLVLISMLITAVAATPTQNCSGNCTHQAAIGSTHYATLAEAITAAQPDTQVTLLQDTSVDKALTISIPLTLDLNAKTLTGNLPGEQDILITCTADTVITGGNITVTKGAVLKADTCAVTIDENAVFTGSGTAPAVQLSSPKSGAAAVTVLGQVTNTGEHPAIRTTAGEDGSCVLTVSRVARVTSESTAISMDGSGKLEISGGTISARLDCVALTLTGTQVMEPAITGGTFRTEEGRIVTVLTDGSASLPGTFVTGGNFNVLPREYIPTFCRITQDPDSSFTVVAEYILSFDANGAEGFMESVKADANTAFILPACGFVAPTGSDFAGWEVNGQVYTPGSTYLITGNLTLKALWATHTHSGGTATCENRAVCDSCGEPYGRLGSHKLTYITASSPTCTENGRISHHKCSVCSKRLVDGESISANALTIPALGHDLQQMAEVPATCTESGIQAHEECLTCGILLLNGDAVSQEMLTLPALGHDLQAIPAVSASCTIPGTQAHMRCTLCDALFLNGEPTDTAALTTAVASHVLSEWVTDETSHWKACVDCGTQFRWAFHSDLDRSGTCDDCSAPVTVPELAPDAVAGFSWLYLLPIGAAVAISISLVLKKRK